MGRKPELAEYRLWKRTKKFANEKGCHLWQGYVKYGLGMINLSKLEGGEPIAVHRLSYQTFVKEIPRGMDVVQTCGEGLCIRPDHLDVVPIEELPPRRLTKGQCVRGHPYTEANTYWYRGGRSCRTCRGMRPAKTSSENGR